MTKRAHLTAASGQKKAKQGQAPDASPTPTSTCEYCGITFTTRGLTQHQNHCKSKKIWSEAKKPRSYEFCILSKPIFEKILSYMGNQTLTKLQMITGDRYPNCETYLSKYCCKCENDNPTVFDHICRACELQTKGYYLRFVKEKVAKGKYGVKDFSKLPSGICTKEMLYDRVGLENYMLEVCGSKLNWVRVIVAPKLRTNMLKQKKDDLIASLAPEFKTFMEVRSFSVAHISKTALKRANNHFAILLVALKRRGFSLHLDAQYCEGFVMSGFGDVDQVVDNMEEKHFLFARTDYPRLSGDRFDASRYEVVPGTHDTYINREGEWKEIKAKLCVQYLHNSKGLTLPQKWVNCRPRFEEVKTLDVDPRLEAL